jgi:hypothetical protein
MRSKQREREERERRSIGRFKTRNNKKRLQNEKLIKKQDWWLVGNSKGHRVRWTQKVRGHKEQEEQRRLMEVPRETSLVVTLEELICIKLKELR